MKFADFVIPETVDEARRALKELGASGYPLAGGTAFQYLSDQPGMIAVDISRLDFKGIAHENGTFQIGANTSLTDLVRYRADGWVLDEVASLIPTHQIRNISTVGGNIARLFPWSEIPLVLLVVEGSRIVIQGDEERTMLAREFFETQPSKVLEPGDLITQIVIPEVKGSTGFGYKKESVTNAAFALASAAATIRLEDGKMTRVRVAIGSAIPVPRALPELEQALEGQKADAGVFGEAIRAHTQHVSWKGRNGMSDEFGKHIGEVATEDALTRALENATGAKS